MTSASKKNMLMILLRAYLRAQTKQQRHLIVHYRISHPGTIIAIIFGQCWQKRNCFFFRWRNWVIRGIFTWVMILGFCFLIYLGPYALMITVSAVKYFIITTHNWLHFLAVDSNCTSEMLLRDHQHWLLGVPYPWIALVQVLVLVLPFVFKLLLLWRKLGGLLWHGHQ